MKVCLFKYIEEGNWIEIGLTVNRNQNYTEFTTSTFSVYALGKNPYTPTNPVYDNNGGGNGVKKSEEYNVFIMIIITTGSIMGISAVCIYYFLIKNKIKRIKQIKQ